MKKTIMTLSLIAFTTALVAVPPAVVQPVIQPIEPGDLRPADLQIDPSVFEHLPFAYVIPTLTIPHEFSAGATAKASEVNANFDKVKESVDGNSENIENLTMRMSGIKSIEPATLTLSTTVQNLDSITINAPADGQVHILSTGLITAYNNPNKTTMVFTWITDESDGTLNDLTAPLQLYMGTNESGFKYQRYTMQRVYTVSKGENTFYVRGLKSGTSNDTGTLTYNRLTATFHASEL